MNRMTSLHRLLLSTLAAAALAGGLSACAPLVVGGAALTGFVAVDRRSSGAQLEDEAIELRAASRLRDALGGAAHVNVTSYNRQVLLTGEVPDAAAKARAEQIVGGIDNVRAVVNELGVMAATSLSQRSNDVLISSKMRAGLVDARDLQSNAFKVVTERATIYLMGRVTQREADRATQVARGIGGVQRVVRVFEILSEEELARLVPSSAPPSGGGARPQ